MMNRLLSTFAVITLGMTPLVMGCGDDDDKNGVGGTGGVGGVGGDGGVGGVGGDGGVGGVGGNGGNGGEGGGKPQAATVRVAHLSPDAPAVDFCVRPNGETAFVGPVMAVLFSDADGLAYSEVTSYLPLPAGTYTVRLVAPGSTNCDTALADLPDATGVALAGAQRYTLAAIGMLEPENGAETFRIASYVDDASVASGMAKLRFIHAAPDAPAVDLVLGSGAETTPLFTNVQFGDAGQANGNAYLQTEPLADVTISARPTDTENDVLTIDGVDLPAGAIATAFAVGNLADDPEPLGVLLCVDSAAPQNNLTQCSLMP